MENGASARAASPWGSWDTNRSPPVLGDCRSGWGHSRQRHCTPCTASSVCSRHSHFCRGRVAVRQGVAGCSGEGLAAAITPAHHDHSRCTALLAQHQPEPKTARRAVTRGDPQFLSARCRALSASTSSTKRSSSDQLIGGEALGLSPCQGCLSCARFRGTHSSRPSVSTEKTGRETGRREAEPPEMAQITEMVAPDAMVLLEPTNLLRIPSGWRSEHPS